jgi:alkylation response protein AidB-like acyl-CoA dehydrogenase
MDLSLSESQKMFKSAAREFAKQECSWTYLKGIDESPTGFSLDLWKKVAEMGWLGMFLPESCGGMGCNLLDLSVIYEEMGYALLPGAFFNSSVLCGSIIEALASDSQKRQILPLIASGQSIYTLAFTEADYGWSPEYIRLSATRKGDRFILEGVKRFVPDIDAADWIICPVRTGEAADPSHGISVFLINRRDPGVHCRSVKGFTGDKLYEVSLDKLELPLENLLGSVNQAWPGLSSALTRATAVLCAYMVGGCQYLLDLTVQYAQTRVQFNQPIGAFQWVQGYIIEQANQLERARWSTLEALWKLDSGQSLEEQEKAVSMAKAVCSEAFLECGHLSHEVHAGIGVDKKYPLYLWSKKSKSLFSYLGDPNYHRGRLAAFLRL